MSTERFFIKRMFTLIPVLLGISVISFGLAFLAPGDPAELILDQNGIASPSLEQVSALSVKLGLNKPWYEQYASWLERFLQGDLGNSYRTGNAVFGELKLRFPVTFWLAALASCFAGVGGIGLGILSVIKKGTVAETFIGGFFSVLLSLPNFVMSLLLVLVAGEALRLLPTSGIERLSEYVLPALALAFPTMAIVGRFVKTKLLEELGKPYCLVAMTHGLKEKKIVFLYALPNAISPVIALLGNFFGNIVGGAVIVETIFALPGLGSLALDAIKFRDYPLLQGYVLVTGYVFVSVSFLVDLLLRYVNPKADENESV